jgi:hypothetical protein
VMVVVRRIHQGGVPTVRTAGRCGGGEPRSAHTPRIGYTQQPIPVQRVRLGSPGADADYKGVRASAGILCQYSHAAR